MTFRTVFLSCILVFAIFPEIAQADWRAKVGTFKVGLVSKEDRTNLSIKLEPFRLAVEKALRIDVELVPVRSERSLIQSLSAERIEYAILSSSGYALASALCDCVEPIVTSRAGDSSDGYHTVVITAADQALSVNELDRMKLGTVASPSISGMPFVEYLMSEDPSIPDLSTVEVDTFDSGFEMLEAFNAGRLDAIIGWSSMTGDPTIGYSRGTLRQLAEWNGGNGLGYKVIWQSPGIPYRTHLSTKSLDGEAKRLLREMLTTLFDTDPTAYDAIEPDHAGGFVVSRQGRFKPLIEFIDSLHPKPSPLPL